MDKNKAFLLENEFHEFCRKIKVYKYVCIFGVGKKAEHWGYKFAREWGIGNIICFSDNNPKMWGKEIVDGLRCVPPMELIQYRKDLFCVVATNEKNFVQVAKQLGKIEIDHMFLNNSWFGLTELVEKYLKINLPSAWNGNDQLGRCYRKANPSARIAVYTCIVDGYDDLWQPEVCDLKCDYYFLGFEKPQNAGVYQWINISNKLPTNLDFEDATRVNRYCKTHPHIFFPQYEYSIYIDGTIQVQTKLSHLIQKIGKIGIGAYGMPFAEDAYEHASSLCYRNGKGEGKERIRSQMQKYAKEGFPRYFGFTENGVLVREHNNDACILVMETWWDEVLKHSRRDQISFMYAVWKNGFTAQDIGYIDDTFRNGPEFKLCLGHNKKYDEINKFKR